MVVEVEKMEEVKASVALVMVGAWQNVEQHELREIEVVPRPYLSFDVYQQIQYK